MTDNTYPNFAIDDIEFRASNTLARNTLEQISVWRSFDGTLNVQKWGFNPKEEMIFEFHILTEEEFRTLKDLVNNGFHEVTCNIEGSAFHFPEAYLEWFDWNESFAGTKTNIKVKVYEK